MGIIEQPTNPGDAAPMSRLRLHLLGTPRATLDDRPITIQRRKAWALLIYLAVTGEIQRRDTLATLLWPDASQSEARAALTRHLSELRKTIGHDSLTADRETIGLATDVWLDVQHFQQSIAGCHHNTPECLDPLTAAVELYSGDFLSGFTLPDCPDFDDWQFFQTEELRHTLATALERLIHIHSQQDDHAAALPHARRRLALDPLHEPAHRTLMRLYAHAGQQAAAARQYQLCVDTLSDELGVAPSAETSTLHERIRTADLTPDSSPPLTAQPVQDNDPPVASRPEPDGPQPARSPVVARERELAQLHGFLNQVLQGKGRVAFVTGEAGRGKTTLLQEYARQARTNHPNLIVANGNCDAFTGTGDPFLPFREVLARLTGTSGARTAGAQPADRIKTPSKVTAHTIQILVDHAPDLIGSFVPGTALLKQARQVTPARTEWLQKLENLVAPRENQQGPVDTSQSNLFQQYALVMGTLAQERPVLLMLDDLQWADAGSTDLLFSLGRRLEGQRVLIVGTYRPTEVELGRTSTTSDQPQRHPLEPIINEFRRAYGANHIDLQQAEGRALVDGLIDSEPNHLGPEFRAALHRHTQGHALFTVEVLRDMQARGDLTKDDAGYWREGPHIQWDQLPARVEGVISERIARLEPALRETLNAASVMGEEFTAEALARVLNIDERVIIRQLGGALDRQHHLVTNIGSHRQGRQRLSQYQFQHILFQNYLYQNLDQSERAYLHEDAGQALESLHEGRTETVAVQLAHHFQAAGLVGKAVEYLRQAGGQASRMSALEEAVHHFNQALLLLSELPEGADRDRQEYGLQSNLGEVLSAKVGIGAPEVVEAHTKVLALARTLGEPQQIARSLYALSQDAWVSSDLELARTYAEENLQLAETSRDPEIMMSAHKTLKAIAHASGQHADAVAHADHVIAFYRTHRPTLTFENAFELASTLVLEGLNLIPAGYPDRALSQGQEAVALMEQHEHQFGLVHCNTLLAFIHLLRGEWRSTLRVASLAAEIAQSLGVVQMRTFAEVHRGVAMVRLGEAEAGTRLVHKAINERVAIGSTFGNQTIFVWLAEACGQAGRAAEGLTLVNDALAHPDTANDHQYEPKMHQIKGDLLLLQDTTGTHQAEAEQEAEACFRRAIDIAHNQQAKLWEARALASLCRLQHAQGRGDKHDRQRLADLYAWFSEGFETEDLQVVHAVLQETS